MLMLAQADARALPLADCSINTIVTSPPYWMHRRYDGGARELGQEDVHDCLGWATGEACGECYICHIIDVGDELRRVLANDGTLWLNLGDTYASGGRGGGGRWSSPEADKSQSRRAWCHKAVAGTKGYRKAPPGLKHKDLVGIPHRAALALQASGWWLRSDIIWAKPNPLPERRTNGRPTKAHEHLLLLSKSADYYYDEASIREPAVGRHGRSHAREAPSVRNSVQEFGDSPDGMRAARTVWDIAVSRYRGAHFATMPPDLARRCVRAGCPRGGVVLDPFAGSGTTLQVAVEEGRRAIGLDLNRTYLDDCAVERVADVQVGLGLTG